MTLEIRTLPIDDIIAEIKSRGGLCSLLPSSVTETELYFVLSAFERFSANVRAREAYSGILGSMPFPKKFEDQMSWFFSHLNGRLVAANEDLSAGFVWDDNGQFLLLFGTPEFLELSLPYPTWVSKSRFINGSEDEEHSGWANCFWTNVCG